MQNKSYYIPGDAVVYGTMNNGKVGKEGKFIRIFGHGTLSGDKLPHPDYADPQIPEDEYWPYHPIDIQGIVLNCSYKVLLCKQMQCSIFHYSCWKHNCRGYHNCKLSFSFTHDE